MSFLVRSASATQPKRWTTTSTTSSSFLFAWTWLSKGKFSCPSLCRPFSNEPQEKFHSQDPDWEEKVRQSFHNQGFMKFLQAKLGKLSPGYFEIELDFDPRLTQQHGFFHAGVIGTLADNSGGYAGLSLLPKTSTILTVEFKLNLLSPGSGDKLICRGSVIKAGRNLVVTKSDVFILNNSKEKLCATSLQTLMAIHNKSEDKGMHNLN